MFSLTPGTSDPTDWMFRALGIESISSRVMTCTFDVFCTSTTGDAPDTVTVSSSAPTFISALIGTVTLAGTITSARLNVLNPGRVNVTANVPGLRSMMV